MHNKFMVLDNSIVLTGSLNLSFQSFSNNYENVIISNDSQFVDKYSKYFEVLWVDFKDSIRNNLEMEKMIKETLPITYLR